MDGTRVKVPDEETDIICEKCGRTMVIKSGPVRQVPGLLRFPGVQEHQADLVEDTGGICPKCGGRIAGEEVQERTQASMAVKTTPPATL